MWWPSYHWCLPYCRSYASIILFIGVVFWGTLGWSSWRVPSWKLQSSPSQWKFCVLGLSTMWIVSAQNTVSFISTVVIINKSHCVSIIGSRPAWNVSLVRQCNGGVNFTCNISSIKYRFVIILFSANPFIRHCYKDGKQNTNCPVCAKNLNELARTLPTSHCSRSKLVCAMTGEVLNEHNPPMTLPNGHVYGLKASFTDGRKSPPNT